MKMTLLVPILLSASAVFAQAPTTSPQAAAPQGNAENGRRFYMADFCYACHGTMGQGGRDGARIAPNPPALPTIVRYVRKPSGQMPAYTSRVTSDQELADIYAFLRTIPASPPVQSLPLLNQ